MRVIRAILLATTALVVPVHAKADPVSFFVAGFTGATATATATGLSATLFSVGSFLGTTVLGNLLLQVGLAYLLRPKAPSQSIDAARINSRIADAPRRQMAGTVAVGGEAGAFGEFDEDGNFWYIVIHGDAELCGDPTYILDGIEVTLSSDTVTFGTAVECATTANITLSGEQTIDGVLTSSDRVLVKDQTDATENGVYVSAAGAWVRATDFNASAEFNNVGVSVTSGTTNGSTYWKSTVTDPTLGVDDITFAITTAGDRVAGDVLTDDFCLDTGYNVYEGTGTRVPYFRLYTVTPDSSSAYGTKPSDFTAAFSNLPSDFYLAGVVYTIVRIKAVHINHRHKVYRWRGPMSLGEPGVVMVGNFNRMYDPREVGHDIDDSTTWTAGDGNPAIMWAWWRTHAYGRNRPMSEINWTKVDAAADICDELVTDRSANSIPRYRCGFAAPDTQPRHEAEQEILKTCDGFVAYDDEGKAYPVVGKYEDPTLEFTAARDIMTVRTEIVDDGEASVDGVVVNYISPDHGYTKQPCAPWYNPNYHVDGTEPNLQVIDILGCQDHNQAVRLAKANGLRIGAPKKAALGTTIKGILVKSERAITLTYDTTFTGVYEIATPVKEDPGGQACAFAVVPLASDRWDLGVGEEGAPPQDAPSLNIDDSLATATNVSISAVSVSTDNGAAVRIEATFDEPSRIDRFYEFRYAEDGTTVYEYFTVDMDELLAYSAIVTDGQVYDVTYRTITAGGRASEWSSITQVTATSGTGPDALTGVSVSGGAGRVTATGTAGSDAVHGGVRIYRGTTTDFDDASPVTGVVTGAPAAPFSAVAGDAGAVDLVTNGTFDSDSDWTKGTGWSISGGVASKAAGLVQSILQSGTMTAGATYRFTFDLTNVTVGYIQARIQGSSNVFGAQRSTNGTFAEGLVAPASPANIVFTPSSDFAGDLDNVVVVENTAAALPLGEAYFWVVPVSVAGVEGTPDGPHTVRVY